MEDRDLKIINELRDKFENHFQKAEYDEAVKVIDSVIKNEHAISINILPKVKLDFAALYLDVADYSATPNTNNIDALVAKAFGIFNQLASYVSEFDLMIKCNRARGSLLRYDSLYLKRAKAENIRVLTYDSINSIYDIKSNINDAISYYWEAIKICSDARELYSIKNNLANALSRVGRNVEALILFQDNMRENPMQFQSLASYGDSLQNLIKNSYLNLTPSLFLVAGEKYTLALKDDLDKQTKKKIERSLMKCAMALKLADYELNDTTMMANKTGEQEDYEKLSDYRKFTLENNLSLNEHALYCQCRDAKVDNLKIGLNGGSKHISKSDILPILDGLVNRLISEYTYARLLYYNYKTSVLVSEEEAEYSFLTNNDLVGYHIEQLRASYRIVYSVLDKIANGLLVLFEITKTQHSYFENVFDIYKDQLKEINSLHLTALYSLSLDLNRNNGSLKYFKEFRNELEHGFLAINEISHATIKTINKEVMEKFTLELLKLTRSAIYSFTFLCRTETIILD